ncbi:uncharacterized protein LOC113465746 [Diaphorina citri]|uniref:Uncharacterized protein LOC113465746 n=1 Tax=Diaphorina citri TaxID=121845 RepID=A0A3Q0IJC3_DIACI|nr:uncharacterized protein LOC113465746 [Diaphorina citri]KAI5698305.1 hypothetical protein M8J75_004908 [Diaphorina citri]KAI5723941.1 hypothetical protein M8J76_013076 [Diaphorina citri]KAI5728435.1 hypothetical protein M8J77_016119 [Diaphorina citri]
MIGRTLLVCSLMSVSFILSLDEHLYITQNPTKITFMEYTNEFNLDLLRNLTSNEIDRNYRNIVETIRRKGPEVLHQLNRSELLHLMFTTAKDEKPSDVWSRWNGICDWFLQEGGQHYFEWYVIGRMPQTTTRYPTKNNRGF